MTQINHIAILEGLIPKLAPKDASWAKELLASLKKYGPTAGRLNAIDSLKNRAEEQAAIAAGAKPTTASTVGDFQKVFDLMSKAGETLRMPKIRLMLADKSPIVLGVATDKSQYPGTINVTDGGGFGNKWYGRVDKGGNLTVSPKIHEDTRVELRGLLTKLSEAPAKVAAEYGRLTGRCCFCGRPLEDEQSTAAGFGPTCAKNFGLTDVRLEALPTLYAAQQSEQA